MPWSILLAELGEAQTYNHFRYTVRSEREREGEGCIVLLLFYVCVPVLVCEFCIFCLRHRGVGKEFFVNRKISTFNFLNPFLYIMDCIGIKSSAVYLYTLYFDI